MKSTARKISKFVRKFIRELLPVLLYLCSLCASAAAQVPPDLPPPNNRNLHQWGAISSFHGLPSDRVYAIAQGGDGVIWFGTERGLARYDGRRVQIVTAENFGGVKVLSLKFTVDGTLLIGTQNGAFRFFNEQFELIEQTKEKAIAAILPAPTRGSFVLAGLSGQIYECRTAPNGNLTVTEIPPRPLTIAGDAADKLPINALAVYRGQLLAGTERRGLLHLTADAASLSEVMSRPRQFFVNALEVDQNDNLWLGANAGNADSGLFLANDVYRPEKIGTATGAVTSLAFDANNELWLGTAERGVFHFRGREQIANLTFENTAGGLRSNHVFTILADRENVIWCGTDKGVFRFDSHAPQTEMVSAGAESNFIRTLFQMRGGRIFAGTNRGLFSRADSREAWHENSDFVGKTIFGIAETVEGKLLVGTAGGLYVNGSLQSAAPKPGGNPESVRAIGEFQNKTYLANFGRGVEAVENGERKIVFPLNGENAELREITSLYAESNERLWIGTSKSGVFVFDGKTFSQDDALADLKNEPIRAISGSIQNGLWFAADHKGLFVYRGGELENVLPQTSARSVYLESIAQTENVWTATDKGLFHLKFDSEWGWLRSRLEVEQGLPSQNIFAVLPEISGDLIIGTNRGIVRYQANRIKPLLIPTRIFSGRDYQPKELPNGIKLDFPQNSLALEVAAQSSRTFPEQFQYAFALRDNGGILIKKKLSNDSQFLLENLSAGNYTVTATAFDKDLEASAPLQFTLIIAPAPFPWTAATLGVLLGISLAALAFVVWQRNKIRLTGKQLNAARLDLANEAERERRRIARDLHDQTLADLRHLQLLTDKINDGEAAVIRAEIESVSKEIRRICEDLSPSVLENIGFAAALESALQTIAGEKHFAVRFVADEDFEDRLSLPLSVQIQIYRIAQEVLQNIARHAAAENVSVTLQNTGDFLLIIADDGNGFAPAAEKNGDGRGLNNIVARAQLIEALVGWEKLPRGTIFTLRRAPTVDSHSD